MKFPKTKREITQAILNNLPRGPYHTLTLDQVVFRWWLTGRGGQGLRLTDEGLLAFEAAKLEFYDFPVGLENLTNKTKTVLMAPESFIAELTKKIKCPYYIGVYKSKMAEHAKQNGEPFIRIYDHQTAMMMTIYGNLREYLDSQRL